MTGSPRRGEIWSVHTPGQPDDPHQPRPALVLSEDMRNRARDDFIVAPIFSEGTLGPTRVALPRGAGGIRHDSVIYCEEITTIARQFVARGPWGDRVDRTLLAVVVRAVRRAIGETVPDP